MSRSAAPQETLDSYLEFHAKLPEGEKGLLPDPKVASDLLSKHPPPPSSASAPVKVNISSKSSPFSDGGAHAAAHAAKAAAAQAGAAQVAAHQAALQSGGEFGGFDPLLMYQSAAAMYGMQHPSQMNPMAPWMMGGGYWPMDASQMNPWMMQQQMAGVGGKGGGMYGGQSAAPGRYKASGTKTNKNQRERRRRGRGQGATQTPETAEEEADVERSPELEEVRKHGTNCKLELSAVMDQIMEFAKDQHGSRFIQTKLDEADADARRAVFDAILPETSKLADDVFGNYVLQKLFDIGTSEQKKILAGRLAGEVYKFAKMPHGCRVVQKALSSVPREQQVALALELKAHVTDCIEDQNGNHVIQKCIEQMPPDSVNFIIQAIVTGPDKGDGAATGPNQQKEEVCRLAMHVFGCRVIQRLLEHCASATQLDTILEKIMENIPALSEHAFGNYVIQHVLEHGRVEDKQKILAEIRGNILEYSKKKSSSNVVEKCFEIATIGEHAQLLDSHRTMLMQAVLEGTPPLVEMMSRDKFGNYIVQRMIDYSRGAERDKLLTILRHQANELKNLPTGKHIIAALNKEYPKDPNFSLAEADEADGVGGSA